MLNNQQVLQASHIDVGKRYIQMDGEIKASGRRQYKTENGQTWTRKIGQDEWRLIEPLPEGLGEETRMELKLVRRRQLDGEPNHWSLFLAPENQRGSVFQVEGDATAMHYTHADKVNDYVDLTVSDSYRDSFIISYPTEQQMARVRYWANNEPPPSALNQTAAIENCQGWTIRVIRHLVEEGIVKKGYLTDAEHMQEPVK